MGTMLVLLCCLGFAAAKHKASEEPPFQYIGGTEDLARGCGGRLEVLKDTIAFSCPGGSVSVPFGALTLMEYRPNLSNQVLRMKIPWKVEPVLGKVKDNEFFTIVYNVQGTVHALVLRVDPPNMRPYLAEIELKTGKSVQVYRSYGEFD